MKKIILITLIISMLLTSSLIPCTASDSIKIVVNNIEQTYDVMPVIINGRTLVPLRGIFETLGARVSWEQETKTIIGSKNDKVIVLQADNLLASVGGNEVTLDVPPQIISGRTMVPVRFISEALGAEVGWDNDTKTVSITSSDDKKEDNNYTVVDWEIFKATLKKYLNGFGKMEVSGDEINIKCETLPDKDNKFYFCLINSYDDIIKPGDVCLMSFKVKVNSGEGYVKPWVQDQSSRKSLFAKTLTGKAGEDFVECFLPFVGIPDIRDIGIRFGGSIQDITIKDFKIENFGTTKKLSELPSTITGKNDTSPSFADLIANAQ